MKLWIEWADAEKNKFFLSRKNTCNIRIQDPNNNLSYWFHDFACIYAQCLHTKCDP